ncbi:MAG: hypothetical protein ACXWNI_02635 [Candidatus Limnocylindrales bacterium]
MGEKSRLVIADRLACGALVAAAVASLAGLIVPGLYRDAEMLVWTTRADDSFRLVLVLPILALGLWTARRGSIAGRLIAMGALACLAYLYAFLTTAARVNAMTLAQVAVLGLSVWALLLGFQAIDPAPVERAIADRLLRRTTGVFLLAMTAFSALKWGGLIFSSVLSGDQPAEVVKLGPTPNALFTVELAFLVPLFALAGIRLLRRDLRGGVLALPMLVLLGLLGVGLAWEAVGIAVLGGTLDAGQAGAGIVFAAVPSLLLLAIVVRRSSSGWVPTVAGG